MKGYLGCELYDGIIIEFIRCDNCINDFGDAQCHARRQYDGAKFGYEIKG